MAQWNALPPEIRLKIMRALAESYERYDGSPGIVGRAGYACVSREWQAFIEPYTFRHIVVPSSRLPELEFVLAGDNWIRLAYISKLYFTIDSSVHECSRCGTYKDLSTAQENEAQIANTLGDLLRVLSPWTVERWTMSRKYVYGLKVLTNLDLHIGVSSASHCEHRGPEYMVHENYRFWFEHRESSRNRILDTETADMNVSAHRGDGLPFDAAEPRFYQVEKVTGIFLSRHFFRRLGRDVIRKLCTKSLPRLERLAYETWPHEHGRDLGQQRNFEPGKLQPPIPPFGFYKD